MARSLPDGRPSGRSSNLRLPRTPFGTNAPQKGDPTEIALRASLNSMATERKAAPLMDSTSGRLVVRLAEAPRHESGCLQSANECSAQDQNEQPERPDRSGSWPSSYAGDSCRRSIMAQIAAAIMCSATPQRLLVTMEAIWLLSPYCKPI